MTSSMPWIKIYTDILDDPKMGRLDAGVKWHFIAICVLAGECDSEGYLVNGDEPFSVEDVAWRLRESPAHIGASMEILQNCGLLTQDDDGTWFVTNFSKRQGRPQYEKRKQWRERKQKQREREQDDEKPGTEQEQSGSPENVTRDSRESHGLRERERGEKEKETEKEKDNNAGKPAIDAVPDGLTEGQRLFLAAFGAKRFRTKPQKEAVLALEKAHGTAVLSEGVQWAAKQGMNMGKAVLSLETALPKWGKPKSGDAIKVSGL